jgi:hypothetical protein
LPIDESSGFDEDDVGTRGVVKSEKRRRKISLVVVFAPTAVRK